jgi:hypothetical protein
MANEELNLENEEQFLNEDPQIDYVDKETDREKVQAFLELAEKEAEGESAQTGTSTPESKETEESDKGTSSEEGKEKEKSEAKTDEEGKEKETPEDENNLDSKDKDFVIDDEFINSRPENERKILQNYKGKTKADVEKAVLNAVLYGNDNDPIKALVSTQQAVGKKNNESGVKQEILPEKEEMPPLPEDDPKVKEIVNAEAVKRLRAKYPDLPDTLTGEEYNTFVRNLIDTNPDDFYDFQETRKTVLNSAKEDLKEAIHVYNNNITINNSTLTQEANLIKAELEKYGITDPAKELGIDLTLEKQEDGRLYNKYLSDLMLEGGKHDPNVVKKVAGVPILKRSAYVQGEDGEKKLQLSPLVNKFISRNHLRLAENLAKKEAAKVSARKEQIKSENLNALGNKTSSTSKNTLTLEELDKTTNRKALQEELARMEQEFGVE